MFYIQRPVPTIPDLPGLQPYFPSLEVLFPSLVDQVAGSPTLAASELVVGISDEVAHVEHMINKTVRDVPIWIRRMHLMNPLDVLEGEFVMPRDGALPSFKAAWQRTLRKINDPYNEAYTDAVFACMASRLVETGRSPHFCRFYGTFNGRAPEYRYDITMDMPVIEGEDWFRDGLKSGAFKVLVSDDRDPDFVTELTHPWEDVRRKLLRDDGTISSVSDDDTASDNDTGDSASGSSGSSMSTEEELSDLEEMDMEVTGEATVVRPRLRLQRLEGSDSDSDDSDDSSSDSTEDHIEYRIVMRDFPIQATILERCDGSMDDLMEDEIAPDATVDMRETKEQRWTAWMFQVIAALTTAQSTYDFVHNDLHTNNVMWCGTGETHLYYHVTGGAGGDRYYRVPTYGRIFKIIDFGRATFRPPSAGRDNHVWFPDVYGPGGDAHEQYNCGPYFNQKNPKVLPNKSFDLCRLAVAILDTLWAKTPDVAEPRKVMTREPGRHQAETVSPLWNLMWLWLTDRKGCNILKTPDDRERYKTFDLYCAIARDAVNAVPAQQLTLPLFDGAFRCKRRDIPNEAPIYKLQAVHRHG